ncbi:Transcription elongation factor SPT4 [Nymphon striatum]|nr:Transcription elongation factor SPT4 [Nymphon striatum]
MSMESIPKDLRNLRACLLCSMVKTFEQFEMDGCDNCDEFLGMKNNRDGVYECTSSNFDGYLWAGKAASWLFTTEYAAFYAAFQQVVLNYLKNEFPKIKKVRYFTDGCAGQYKNKQNFINLCCHQKDFGLEAEWNFFSTSHGKSTCDGIGGTVKRLLTKASLQRSYSDPILTIEAIMEFCVEKISGIKFFNVPPKDVKKFATDSRNRFEISTTIKGTHQFHRFVPLSPTHLSVYKLSAQVDLPVVVAITALAEHDNISE